MSNEQNGTIDPVQKRRKQEVEKKRTARKKNRTFSLLLIVSRISIFFSANLINHKEYLLKYVTIKVETNR